MYTDIHACRHTSAFILAYMHACMQTCATQLRVAAQLASYVSSSSNGKKTRPARSEPHTVPSYLSCFQPSSQVFLKENKRGKS